MAIKGFVINGVTYPIDYDGLENKPDLTKDTIPTANSEHYITSGAVHEALSSIAQGSCNSVTVDSELSLSSTNPVANSVVTQALNAVIPTVTSEDQGKVLTVNSEGEWQPESLDIPEPVDPLPSVTSEDQGKVLTVNSSGEWQPESLDIPESVPSADLSAICEALRSEINSLKTRVYILEHGDGSTASSISGDKLSLIGTNTVVTGEKLSVTGSGFTVNGEKLNITEEV